MNLLEIVMLIIGIIIIIISCWKFRFPDNDNESTSYKNNPNDDKQHTEKITLISEEIIAKTEDYLSKLSNEKIMAVNEFSEQILEKISRNHEEVVFLYNMLTNKEKELKDVVRTINDSQRKAKELIAKNEESKCNSPVNTELPESFDNVNKEVGNQPMSNSNEKILNLYSQGKSVMEISKQLGIGQGEVKLVIDLFKGKL